jgi:thioredoxin-like negative regulator of GroEL/SAM-dependent methyltransferase
MVMRTARDARLAAIVRNGAMQWGDEAADSYHHRAAGLIDEHWNTIIRPILSCHDIDLSITMDFACGYGRNARKLRDAGAGQITLVDVHPDNIAYCQTHLVPLGGYETFLNTGFDLDGLPSATFTHVYSFDAMVHFDIELVLGYIAEFARVLKPGGTAFIHHSNFTGRPGSPINENPHWRNFMSAGIFRHAGIQNGFEILQQKILDWVGPGDHDELDCVTVMRRRNPAERQDISSIDNNRRNHRPGTVAAEAHDLAAQACNAEWQWNWKKAITLWDRLGAIAKDESAALAITRKAQCLIEMGCIDQARHLLWSITDQIEGVAGLAQLAMVQGQRHIAAQYWDQCAARFPENATGFLGKAALLFDREAYAEAEAMLSDIVQSWPDSVAAAGLWGRCATALKNWEVAGSRWEGLLARHPADRGIRVGYVQYLAALGDRPAANSFLATLSDHTATLIDCLVAYQMANDDFGAAIETIDTLVELESEKPWHRLFQAAVLMRHGTAESLQTALSVLRGLLDGSPDSVTIKIRLIQACVAADDAAQAKALLQTIPADDHRPEVETLRAWLLHQEGDDNAAKPCWGNISERQYVPALHAPIATLTRIDGNAGIVEPGDVLLFAVVRNEQPRLQWFLDYYRNLGVAQFVIIDNASTDDSVKLLLGNPDIILYRTDDRFGAAGMGMRWINELINRHGRKNWCVHVDADEALVFPGDESLGLPALTAYLSARGFEAMLTPQLDMYPSALPAEGSTGKDWFSRYVYFDQPLYSRGHPISPYREVYGGVRRRLFGGYHLLTKAALINGAAGISFLLPGHRTTPARLADVTGALRHYHLVYVLEPAFQPLLAEAISRREYASNALERLRSREELARMSPMQSLLCGESVRFESSKQLVELGGIEVSDRYLQFTGLAATAGARSAPRL